MNAGMEGLRDALAEYLRRHGAMTPATGSAEEFRTMTGAFQEDADALLASDGLLFPALRALGCIANDVIGATSADADVVFSTALAFLENYGITGPLADACLAAAEVES